jgi:photosystem II stability/assembly factor-like uncharacterized protein
MVFLWLGDPAWADVKIDSGTFGNMQARSIGPAVMGGRIAALDAVMEDRLTVYVGAATGGLWKSIDGGTTFKPVFDKYTQSIGAVTIDKNNPKVVWVGTGESWVRNSVSVGDGVYKTTDGGENWKHIGLKDSERITSILLDPKNGETAYVCVTGHLWNAHEERGVYKTRDGGQNWERVLYVNGNTGCGGLAMDPSNHDVLFAGMWQFRRRPDYFTSGGPGSGLYKTTDGGQSWRKITEGLPKGELGRIAIAVAPTKPSRVYATVESENTGMYRSDDSGESWSWVGSSAMVEGRPFYFSLLVADPKDENRIYKPGTFTVFSEDGGETFSGLMGRTHADHHAFWINPDNPDQIMVGTDGGLYVSNDRGAHFTFRQSLPIAQFYHVSHDMADPYHVYGGLQDNGTWRAPSQAPAGVQNKHWDNIGFGDGFHAHVDRQDPDIVYVEWQGGRIQRVRMSIGEAKNIQPLPRETDPKFRFNWNAPIHLSPNRSDTLYIGAQFLFRSRDRGESWNRISPDLTTNDPAKQKQIESGGLTPDNSTAENHCTLYTISESPLDENVIWTGSDDGVVQVTQNGGRGWHNVTRKILGPPANTWVTHIEASHHDRATAYVTLDGHRTGDKKSYVYKTIDFGLTWTSLATPRIEGYCLCIREDPVNPDLLFLGTEFGLYISLDGGNDWARFKGKLPKVGVRDMVIHPREHDLILATHGRGIYIIDDITPLRQLTQEVLESDVAMLASRPSQMRIPSAVQEFPGDDEFVGAVPPSGATIAYYLKKRHLFGDLKLEVLDSRGAAIATLPGGKRNGINRVHWSMRKKGPKIPPASGLVPQFFAFLGPAVSEGTYSIRLIKGEKTHEGKLQIVADPRSNYTPEDKALQDETVGALYLKLGELTYLVDSVIDLREKVKQRAAGLDGELAGALDGFADDLETFRRTLVASRKGGFLAGDEQLRERLGSLYGDINGFEGRPTETQVRYAKVLAGQLDEAREHYETILHGRLDDLNNRLRGAQVEPIKSLSRADWEKSQ